MVAPVLVFAFTYGVANTLVQFMSRPAGIEDVNRYTQCEVVHGYTGTKGGKPINYDFKLILYCSQGKATVYYDYHKLDEFNVETCDPNVMGTRFLVSAPVAKNGFPNSVTLYIVVGGGYCEYREYEFKSFDEIKKSMENAKRVKMDRCSVIFPVTENDKTYEKVWHFDYCESLDNQFTAHVKSLRTGEVPASEFFPLSMSIPKTPSESNHHTPLLSCSLNTEDANFKLLCSKVNSGEYVVFIEEGITKMEKAVVKSCEESAIVTSILPPKYRPDLLGNHVHTFRYKYVNSKCYSQTYTCNGVTAAFTHWCDIGKPEIVDCGTLKIHPVEGRIGLWTRCEGPSQFKHNKGEGPVMLDELGVKKRSSNNPV